MKKETTSEDFLNKIYQFLITYYQPCNNPVTAHYQLSTQEIFEQLIKLYPSANLTIDVVAEWLHKAGFTFADFGNMNFKWLLIKGEI